VVTGNTRGLKNDDVRALERLKQRRMKPQEVVGLSMARTLVEISMHIRRRVGVLIDRRGRVRAVAVGDANRIWVPEFGRLRAGTDRLRGLRWIVTRVTGDPLTRDDLVDLVRLRLDLSLSLTATADGVLSDVQMAHVAPYTEDGDPHVLLEPCALRDVEADFRVFISDLEDSLQRAIPSTRVVDDPHAQRAVLVHVQLPREPPAESVLGELRELARTARLAVVAEEVQRRKAPDHRYVFGRGRLEEIMLQALQLEAEIVVFGSDLTPAQMRAISTETELKVIDRTQLILDIFAQHATTREGKLQVELAQLRYLLPRLHGKHTALSRLAGGIGGRGPGETKLEIDRRRVKDRISNFEKKIKELSRQRETRRRQRRRKSVPIVGIVGYTNAGKSTLLNSLTGAEVLAENMLFATLDPTSRRLRFPEEREIVLTDTVGFIRDLPGDLLHAFRSTLEELAEADLLLHVVDIADPDADAQIESVERTLQELSLLDIPRVLVLNKADMEHSEEWREVMEERRNAVVVTAMDKQSLRPLIKVIGSTLFGQNRSSLVPDNEGSPPSAEYYPGDSTKGPKD